MAPSRVTCVRNPLRGLGGRGATGFAHNQRTVQPGLARREIASRDTLEHDGQRGITDFPGRLAEGCQGNREQRRVLDIVDADEPHVLRQPIAQAEKRLPQNSSARRPGFSVEVAVRSFAQTMASGAPASMSALTLETSSASIRWTNERSNGALQTYMASR